MSLKKGLISFLIVPGKTVEIIITGNANLKFHKGGSKKIFPEESILFTINISTDDIFDFRIGLF